MWASIISFRSQLVNCVSCFLKWHTYTRVQVSIDICGVDHPSRKRRFEVVHNLLSTRYNSHIRVQTSADEVTRISSVVSPFPSAGRWERFRIGEAFGRGEAFISFWQKRSNPFGASGNPKTNSVYFFDRLSGGSKAPDEESQFTIREWTWLCCFLPSSDPLSSWVLREAIVGITSVHS
jgi:hypothetical protein